MVSKSQVKYIQSLDQKKFRDEAGEFVAEGPKIINELLLGKLAEPVLVYAVPGWIEGNASLIKLLAPERMVSVTEAELERLSFLSTPNQVTGIFKKPRFNSDITPEKNISLMLDGIQDPGNLGTIVRTADWFGIRQIICSADCADAFSPKVVQSTMGSIARIQLLYTSLTAFMQEHPSIDYYAATLGGEPLHTLKPLKEGIIVIGNESKGISGDVLKGCSRRVTIEKYGGAESLNAAVATGIVLAHVTGKP